MVIELFECCVCVFRNLIVGRLHVCVLGWRMCSLCRFVGAFDGCVACLFDGLLFV